MGVRWDDGRSGSPEPIGTTTRLAATIVFESGDERETFADLDGIDARGLAVFVVLVDPDDGPIRGLRLPMLPGRSSVVVRSAR